MLSYLLLRKSRPKKRQTAHDRDQEEQEELARHRSILLHLAEQDGRCIPPENIIAEVRSGERLSKRPEFSSWLKRLKEHPPPAGTWLYAMEIDRISRGIASERGYIQETIAAAEVKIRTPSGVMDLGDIDSLLLYEVRGSLSRHELQKYKRRVEATKREMTRLGQLPTGAPAWGYLWDKNLQQPVPDPDRFPVLLSWCQDVFRMSAQRLADRDGVYPTLVYRTLRNPMIAGYPARRWKAIDGKLQRLPRGEWIWPEQPGTYPTACTREHWEAIQLALNQRFTRLSKNGQEPNGWCRNLIRFEGCPYRPRLGSIWRWAPIYEVDPKKTSLHYYIRRDVVHSTVEAALLRCQERAGRLLEAAATHQAMVAQRAVETAHSNGRDELAAARQELVRLMSRWAKAEEPEEQTALLAAEATVKRRISELKRRQSVGEREPDGSAALAHLLPELPALLPHWEAEWREAPDDLRQHLAEVFIARVDVRCAPVAGKKRLKREVTGIRWQPWLEKVME